MTDSLAASCAELAAWLPAAAALIAVPDTDGTAGSGQPGSAPPWNTPAAYALTGAAEGIRRLEASMRRDVTGRYGPKRGGSDVNTMAALKAIENLGHGVAADDAEAAAALLQRWTRAVWQLPAVDKAEPWLRVQGATCPYCTTGTLRLQRRAGRVTCSRYGACADTGGSHPAGFVQHSVSGDPIVAWADGFIQHAAMAEDGPTAP
jgi:hypothetical protein